MKIRYKPVILFLVGIVLGFLLAMAVYNFNIGWGGGFHLKSTDGRQKLYVLGTDRAFFGSHEVHIFSSLQNSNVPIFTYLHHMNGLGLREQGDKKIEWSDDFKIVKGTYRDKIFGEEVCMTFEYNFDSKDWTLKKTRPWIK